MLRYIKILMILMVGLFGINGSIENLVQHEEDLALVSQVVSGEGTYGVGEWQTIDSPWLVMLCWAIIPISKFVAGVLCLLSVQLMWAQRHADADAFQRAKSLGLAGCGVMLAMLFGIFVLISDTWFQQWQTELGKAILDGAQRYMVAVGVLAFFVHMRDD